MAASSGYGPPPGRCEALVMSGSGACAELLSALSLGHASGPVHEGTSCFQGALPAGGRPHWDKRYLAVARCSGITCRVQSLRSSRSSRCCSVSVVAPGARPGSRFYEGRCFCKADVAASSGYGPPPGRCEALVMSGSGACAELLSALSLGHASGPVHEGTSCFQGALPAGGRPHWDKRYLAVARCSGITCRVQSLRSSRSSRCCSVSVVAPGARPGSRFRYAASRAAAWRSGS